MKSNIYDTAVVKGVNCSATKPVQVRPLPPHYKKAIEESGLCKASRCFDNSWILAVENIIPNVEYVLALGVKILPVEHAIICVNGVYYDPTWELHLGGIGKEYLVIAQWGRKDLINVAKQCSGSAKNIYPPMLKNMKKNIRLKHLFDCEV